MSKGGDTDTNACIVGGMMGALHGIKGIPEQKVRIVKERKEGERGPNRPKWLIPKYTIDDQISKLLQLAPEKLIIESGSEEMNSIIEK